MFPSGIERHKSKTEFLQVFFNNSCSTIHEFCIYCQGAPAYTCGRRFLYNVCFVCLDWTKTRIQLFESIWLVAFVDSLNMSDVSSYWSVDLSKYTFSLKEKFGIKIIIILNLSKKKCSKSTEIFSHCPSFFFFFFF